MNNCKCFFIDVDGVLTNGTKLYRDDGLPGAKKYYDKDFTGLKILRALGFDLVFVSGDDFVNKKMAENRKIKFISARNLDKAAVISDYLRQNYPDLDVETFGIGDDIFDLSMLEMVDRAFCPSDSALAVKNLVVKKKRGIILNAKGGEGCIQEIAEMINPDKIDNELYEKIIALDALETF